MVSIYGLIDPISNELRYIGKTVDLNRRYRRHISERYLHDSYKDRWIRKLVDENLKPELLIIDEVSDFEWQFWESSYISYFKSIGCRLTNGTAGGDQPPTTKGRHHTEESKLKMSNSKKGKPIPWLNERIRTTEECLKLSKALKGRISPNKDKTFSKELRLILSEASTCKRSVDQLDNEGNIIKTWPSIASAQKTLKIRHVSECCRGVRYNRRSGGFRWKYNQETQ